MSNTPEIQAAIDAMALASIGRAWSYAMRMEVVRTAAIIAKATSTPLNVQNAVQRIEAVQADHGHYLNAMEAANLVQLSFEMP